MRRYRTAVVLAALVVAAAGCSSEESGEPKPKPDDGVVALYAPLQSYVPGIVQNCNEAADGAYKIVHKPLPREASEQLKALVRRSAAKDGDLDLLGLDVTWVPTFAESGWLAEWTGDVKAEASADVFAAALQTATWRGKLYAAPWTTTAQLLWYDKSLTPKPPKTWESMLEQARELEAKGKPHQIVFTGADYEGLAVLFNNLVATAGGHILSHDGSQVALDGGAQRAVELLAQLNASGAAFPGVSTAQEQQTHEAFAAENSTVAFQINWPYVHAAMADLNPARAKNLGWTTLPGFGGKPGRASVGGFNLAVGAHSTNKQAAFAAALCLRDEQQQKYSAICGGVPPTLASVFADDEPIPPCDVHGIETPTTIGDAFPTRDALRKALESAASRPLTPSYPKVSAAITGVLSPLENVDPTVTPERLREELTRALN